MAAFADWLNANAGSDDLRAKVTRVAVCLDDLKACSEERLSQALNLDDWPLLARDRFLDAWRVLKAEGATPAPAVAAPAPATRPAPKARHRTSSPESDTDDYDEAPSSLKAGDRVHARWKGREKYFLGWVAAVHEDGDTITYDINYDDGENERSLDARYVRASTAPAEISGREYDALVLAAAQPQTSRHQRSQAARRQSFSSLVDTGKSYGEAPADNAPPSSLKRGIRDRGRARIQPGRQGRGARAQEDPEPRRRERQAHPARAEAVRSRV